MQWLIDIIKEWIIAQGYLTTSFVDRGDHASHDFETGDFGTGIAWKELDLSAIVPAGAKAVLICFKMTNSAVTCKFHLAKFGNTNLYNVSHMSQRIAGVINTADFVVPLSTDRKIQYRNQFGVFSWISLDVKGWWL